MVSLEALFELGELDLGLHSLRTAGGTQSAPTVVKRVEPEQRSTAQYWGGTLHPDLIWENALFLRVIDPRFE